MNKMNVQAILNMLEEGALDARLSALYGEGALTAQKARYQKALCAFRERFGEREGVRILSVPGRSELLGNHTDHNRGLVIATAIDLDVIAVAAPQEGTEIHLKSEGYPEDVVDFSRFNTPDHTAFGTSRALIAGMCHALAENQYRVGGFVAYTTSLVPTGAGLSSSAAFEVLIGTVENHLYNEGTISSKTLAAFAQYAENAFFGKPCGLMDQLACATGGVIAIDFEKNDAPVVEKWSFDPGACGYRLCVINTGGSHADLTADYASVPTEMKAVARTLGKEVLREVDEALLTQNMALLRREVGDRALLRALHFFAENKRVLSAKAALAKGDVAAFFDAVASSGRSSFCYLQNVYSPKNPEEQGISLALCLAEQCLKEKGGVWRVHGGGFAGTVQVWVKEADLHALTETMNAAFGPGACTALSIRDEGATAVL